MAIKLSDKPNVEAPSAAYPFGSIRDTAGGVLGTPVSREVYGDFHQFFEKLMELTFTTHNGLPDNNSNGFQLVEALRKFNGGIAQATFLVSQFSSSHPTYTQHGSLPPAQIEMNRTLSGVYNVSFQGVGIPQGLNVRVQPRKYSNGNNMILTELTENSLVILTFNQYGIATDGILDNFLIIFEWVEDSF